MKQLSPISENAIKLRLLRLEPQLEGYFVEGLSKDESLKLLMAAYSRIGGRRVVALKDYGTPLFGGVGVGANEKIVKSLVKELR